jgi:integrase
MEQEDRGILLPTGNRTKSRASERRFEMGLYRRGSVWWMRFTYQAKQYRQSTETEDKKLAQRILDKVKGEIAEGKWFEKLPGEDRTFAEMMEKYMEEHSEPKKASTERDKASLVHLSPYFGEYAITTITPKMISEYKSKRRQEGASPGTVNRELALMKHAFNLARKEWGWITDNPIMKVAMEKEPPSRDRWLTYEEEEKLLSASPQWLKEIIAFAVETGCRREEILSLQWKDVDLFRRVATIFGKKTGERRTIPLTQRVFEVLKEREKVHAKVRSITGDLVFSHPPGVKVSIHNLRWVFEQALQKAGIQELRFHDLRHTFASRLAQNGIDPYSIQKLMGHSSFSTTQRYAHHFVESLRRGIDSLEISRQERHERVSTNLAQ